MCANGLWHTRAGVGASVAVVQREVTIYRTRYRDPKEQRCVNAWETRVGAKAARGNREALFSRKATVAVERFEANLPRQAGARLLLNELGE